ncbi:MAPEG family protein [Aestuariibius sp. 2305UL40-4]|uniref:MAPEG family protein n=1 Tax=Aestuariibius violaceus TaxID=3234132 RepID=UPI00345EB0AC
MSVELYALTAVALLAASLWIPYIAGVNTSEPGSPADADSKDFSRPANPALQRPWVRRAYRAHLNLLEQGMPFAILVLIAFQLGISSGVTVWASVLFVALRLAHAIGMITGMARFPARPIIFTAAWACCIAIGVEILRLG